MTSFPRDPTKHRAAKILFQIDVLRDMDMAIDSGLGGYRDRHDLVNDLVEQGLIDLRYPDEGHTDVAPTVPYRAPNDGSEDSSRAASPANVGLRSTSSERNGDGSGIEVAQVETSAPTDKGAVIENALARVPDRPMFGMHNRDAPSAWALGKLAHAALDGPVPLREFYEAVTREAWEVAEQLEALEAGNESGHMKLAIMLPRNRQKPQSAADGFQAFALGSVARKPDEEGLLLASGPFYQWRAVGIVGEPSDPMIGLTESGWELVKIFNGLDFILPHGEEFARPFFDYLAENAPADTWGFQTTLEGISHGMGRIELAEHLERRLVSDFPSAEWKPSISESIASGYLSRGRAWGLVETGMVAGKYALTAAGEVVLPGLPAPSELS
jgi:hypothetical protein